MQEKHLTQASIILIIIGVILFLFTNTNEFSIKTIQEMKQGVGEKGIVIGKVDVVLNQEPLIFVLKNDDTIKVFCSKKMDLKKNDLVEVIGKTETYNNELEIVAQKVIKK